MTSRRLDGPAAVALVLAALAAATAAPALAEEVQLSDGSRWEIRDLVLTRIAPSPAIQIRTAVFNVGIGCAEGLDRRYRVEHRAYVPPSAYPVAVEEPDGGRVRGVVCADLDGAAVVTTITWTGAPTASDHASVRGVLEALFTDLKGFAWPASSLSLFQPSILAVPLDARTGTWNFVSGKVDAMSTLLLRPWPQGPPAAISMNRPRVRQRCDEVGLRQPRPSWAPASFYPLGATRGDSALACLDPADGHALIVQVRLADPADGSRVRALLEAIAAAAGAARPPATAPPPPAPAPPAPPVVRPSPAATPTPRPVTSAPLAAAATTAAPSYDGSPDPYTRTGRRHDEDDDLAPYAGRRDHALGLGRRHWRGELHQLAPGTAVAATEAALGAGAGVGALRLWGRPWNALAGGLEYDASAAVDRASSVTFDTHAGAMLGLRPGPTLVILGGFGVGLDGLGLGAADDRPALDAGLYGYAGVRARLALGRRLGLDAWARRLDRAGDVGETRYGAELTIHRRRGASVVVGAQRTTYDDLADRVGVSLGLRR